MKKIVCVMLCPMLVILPVGVTVSAEETIPVEVKAKAAVLMDGTTGKVLMKMNENEKLYPASVTKIMTLLLVMEAIDSNKIRLTDIVTTSPVAASKGGSQIWLKEGEQMSVDELLKATAVYSANDACTALGEYIAGSDEGFVAMMNERAAELGMKNTHFENCTGLDDDAQNHLTTAYDIALMSKELMKHELIKEYTTIWMDSLRDGKTELVNTNKLIRFYNGATGLKTGTTNKAGCCVAATATRDGTSLIAVVMGSDNSTDRFEGAKAMLNWGFANYETVTPEIDYSIISDVRVLKGTDAYVTPTADEVKPITLQKGMKDRIETEITLAESIEAPCEENQILGKITLTVDGEAVGEINIRSKNSVERINFGVMLLRFLKVLSKSL